MSNNSTLPPKRAFISEAEVEEDKVRRQKAWEEVYAGQDKPPPMPEETYDGRTLYERLKEQRDKKEAEFQDSIKLSKRIHRIDDDEYEYYAALENDSMERDVRRKLDDREAITQFKSAVKQAVPTIAAPSIKSLRMPGLRRKGTDDGEAGSGYSGVPLTKIVASKLPIVLIKKQTVHEVNRLGEPLPLPAAAALNGAKETTPSSTGETPIRVSNPGGLSSLVAYDSDASD